MRSDSWQIERDFVPSDLASAAELRRAIVRAGHRPSTAGAIVGWLLEKHFDGTDHSAPDARSRYRKILASLDGHYRGPRPKRRVSPTPPLCNSPRSSLPVAA